MVVNPMVEACYTCRYRRIQCDKTSIPCRKCRKAGFECHQKRPIRWVKGVAIRGKMQGVSYSRLDSPAGDEQGLIKLRREGKLCYYFLLHGVLLF
jgi:hypothetical protein